MSYKKFDMLERMGNIFEYSHPREPFEAIERLSFAFLMESQ